MNTNVLSNFIDSTWEESIILTLENFIKIPNKSPLFDAQWKTHGHMQEAVKLISQWCKAHAPKNMSLNIIEAEGRTPLIFIEIPGQYEETVLLYGHLDKQPEMEGWANDLGPWQPVRKKEKLYGRGGADDGYAVFTALTAINALQQQQIAHARCLIVIEASEESGSTDLPWYIEHLKDKIRTPDLIVCLDSGCGDYQRLWNTTSLRGMVAGTLKVEILTEGLHSGAFSGIVPSSFRIARQLLSRLENPENGEILLKELYCDIPTLRLEQTKQAATILGKSVYQEIPFTPDAKPMDENITTLLLNRSWKPTLSITGADGIPSIANAGNVLRPRTLLKLSFRLPPNTDPQIAHQAVKKILETDPPYQAKVQYKSDTVSAGWDSPMMTDWLTNACDYASTTFFGKTCAYMGEGGSIPFMGMLGNKFPNAQFLVTGVLGPHSNAHGPNEFLHLTMAKKLTACVSYVLAKHACSLK